MQAMQVKCVFPPPHPMKPPRNWHVCIFYEPMNKASSNISNFISACGGVMEGESGIISSPNYPAPYNSSSHCSWLLVAPEGHTINVSNAFFISL